MPWIRVAFFIIVMAGCQTAAPYMDRSTNSVYHTGYSDYKIAPDQAIVSFRGSEYDDAGRIRRALLLRAAEVTLDNRYGFFTVHEVSEESTTVYQAVSGYVAATRGKSTQTATIRMYDVQPDGVSFDAQEVLLSLEPQFRE